MTNSIDLMKIIDKLRVSSGMTVPTFTKNIVSQRNYSRYKSGEIKPSLIIIEKLAARMNVSLLELSTYVGNTIEDENVEETNFLELVLLNDIDKAYEQYYNLLMRKELKTKYSIKSIPSNLIYVEYKKNKRNKADTLARMRKIIGIDILLKTMSYGDDVIEALFTYVNIAGDDDKRVIIQYLSELVWTHKYKQFLAMYQKSTMLLYITAIKALTTLSTLSKTESELLEKFTVMALKFNIKARIKITDFLLYETLYKFIRRKSIDNPYIAYYYITSILISKNTTIMKKCFEFTKEDIEQYKICINDKKFLNESMYERIIKNGVIR